MAEASVSETTGVYRDPEPFALEAQGHSLVFYPGGDDRRRALMDLVGSATTTLDICFYIFAEDEVSSELRDALCAAARRGVAVTLILDSFGASASDRFLQPLVDAGGRYFCFSPRIGLRYLIRNHQKMVIADGERALFGGFNIEDDYFAPPEQNGWNDLAIALEGDAVAGLNDWFARLVDWPDDDAPHFRAIRRAVSQWEWRDGEGAVPYTLLRRIARVAKTGRARLLMAAKSDNGATLGATRSLYRYLLKRKARIWEFSPCKLHTKLLVLDDAVYLGSANFDMRSLYLNLEIMLRIEDAALAERMREFIAHQIAASEEITPALHAQRSTLFNRIRWGAGWVLVSVLDYTVTRRLNLGI